MNKAVFLGTAAIALLLTAPAQAQTGQERRPDSPGANGAQPSRL
ncbi:MAG TPA: hypothetical protein VM867_00970 [Xanthobacteraceae bacterium]|nr:hypothetical protein [Xanthobacteraceae bacterium]